MNKERLEEANKKFLETIENTPKQQELSLAIQRGDYEVNVDEVFEFASKDEFTKKDIELAILYSIMILHNKRYHLGALLHESVKNRSKEEIPYEKYKIFTDNMYWSLPDNIRELVVEKVELTMCPESHGGKRQRV